MKKAKIFYVTPKDEQTKYEKLKWFDRKIFQKIDFDHIIPDQKANWINLTDNDFDQFLPLIDKQVKAGKSEEAIFQLFSSGIKTQRDEWVYDFSKNALIKRMKYFVGVYKARLKNGVRQELDIKWDRELEKYMSRKIQKDFEIVQISSAAYRPFSRKFLYFDKHFNGMTYQLPYIFPFGEPEKLNNLIVCSDIAFRSGFNVLAVSSIPDLHLCATTDAFQCLPLYRYDENGNRIENITDWGLNQIQTHYNDPTITKENIFHYTYPRLTA